MEISNVRVFLNQSPRAIAPFIVCPPYVDYLTVIAEYSPGSPECPELNLFDIEEKAIQFAHMVATELGCEVEQMDLGSMKDLPADLEKWDWHCAPEWRYDVMLTISTYCDSDYRAGMEEDFLAMKHEGPHPDDCFQVMPDPMHKDAVY